jgi:hypothetical protein
MGHIASKKASEIVDRAGSYAEGLCHCRHVKMHMDGFGRSMVGRRIAQEAGPRA